MDDDAALFRRAVVALYVAAPLTFLYLHFRSAAPYGRHARPGWGAAIPAPLAWFVMESPTLWLPALVIPLGRHRSHPLAVAAAAPFLLHYLHRVLVFPLRLRRSRPVPSAVAFFAFAFNLVNAYVQARSLSHYAAYTSAPAPASWLRVVAGLAVFALGMRVNVTSDLALLRLKKEAAASGGYGAPRGGWFEVVSCPNYTGEAVEWLGWALVAASPAAWAFVVYTCANLAPRARAHRRWYMEKFGDDVPAARVKAFIPFVY